MDHEGKRGQRHASQAIWIALGLMSVKDWRQLMTVAMVEDPLLEAVAISKTNAQTHGICSADQPRLGISSRSGQIRWYIPPKRPPNAQDNLDSRTTGKRCCTGLRTRSQASAAFCFTVPLDITVRQEISL